MFSQNQLGDGDNQKQIQAKKRPLINLENLEENASEESMQREANISSIKNYVGKNPIDAAKLIHAWLNEEEL